MYFSHIFYCLLHTRLGEKIKMNYFEIVVLMLHVQSEFNRNQGKTIMRDFKITRIFGLLFT